MNQQEIEELKCRECVEELNRLAEHERYRYLGHLSELERKHFNERLIKDRRTSKELHVECSRWAPDWTTVERANLQMLERRFAADLPPLGYENHEISLYMRDRNTHQLQKLNRSGVGELARNIKQFLSDQKPHKDVPGPTKFNLDEFRSYSPLAGVFKTLLLSKVDVSVQVTSGSTEVRVGVIAYEQAEIEQLLDQAVASKLGGQADILLIYSEGPLFLFDLAGTIARLKRIAESRRTHQHFGEIWFLAHYSAGGQRLFQIV